MDNIFFFLRDKRRWRFFLYIAAIGIPVLIVCILVISRCDDKRLAAGVDNSEGGKTYLYREKSGIDKFPEPVAAFVAMYPESKTTVCSQDFSFKKELRKTNDNLTKVDSMKISRKEFVATYIMLCKSVRMNDYYLGALTDYLRKNDKNLYQKVRKISTMVCLYQAHPEDEMCMDMFADAVLGFSDEKEGQTVKCNLLIITLYQGKKQQRYYFITSMEEN